MVWSTIGLLLVMLLAGCATPRPRSRYLEEISPTSITNLTAYSADNTLEIRYPIRGKDAFAHATWAAGLSGAGGYRYDYAVLAFGKGKHALLKPAIRDHRLIIRDAGQWKELLQAIFAGLVPGSPGHGVLLLVQNMEIVVYRDATGALKAVTLDKKPIGITLDHTYSDEDFSREAIRILTAGVSALDRKQSQFLFLTGEDPPFVLVDLRERLIVFLSYPADPEAAPVELPGAFVLRTLNSMVIKSLVLTAIKDPFTLVARGVWHVGSSGMTMVDAMPGDSAGGKPPPLYQGPGMDLAAWEKELDGLVSAKRYKGRVQFFVDGNEFFPALIDSIENAKRSVDVMVFIFATDNYAVRIADVLKAASATVRVRVLMDDLGSLFAEGTPRSRIPPGFEPPADIGSYLKDGSRVKVRVTTDPWLATDHRKLFIIDDRQAYLGGMNIGWVYRYEWHDLMIGLTGPIVGRLERLYQKAWTFSGPFGDFGYLWATLFSHESVRKNAISGGIDIRTLRTATGEVQIYKAQLAAIRRARRYIYIENAYFNDDTLLRELIQARQRGVDVRVILPAENDVGIMQVCNLVMANEMIRHGIRVYIYPGMTHVKAAIYDGWACVGSANFEKMSLRVSEELDVAFSDPATVDRLREELFAPDFKRSHELNQPVPLDWTDFLLKGFANQL